MPALHQQHLVDDVHQQLRRDIVEHLPQLRVGGIALGIDLLAHLAKGRNLPGFEVGLGEDLAVDFDEHLLDDFGVRCSAGKQNHEGAEQRASVRISWSHSGGLKSYFLLQHCYISPRSSLNS